MVKYLFLVYLLWKYPELVYRFTTWAPVFKKLTEGAGMCTGIVVYVVCLWSVKNSSP